MADYEGRSIAVGTLELMDELGAVIAEPAEQDLARLKSQGKTAVLVALDNQVIGIFSLEMSKEQLVKRLLCAEAEIDAHKVNTGFLNKDDWSRLGHAAGALSQARIFIDDTDTFATSVHAQLSGEDVAIEKIPRISEHDVIAFYPRKAEDGTYGALFKLDEHGRIALDALSIERRGTFLFIFINGRAITELQIDKRVSDGKIYIPSGLTAADIDSMKRDWRLMGQKKR